MNHAPSSHWQQAISRSTQDFLDAFSHLSVQDLNWKATPDQWSVGQVIDHLITTNKQYFPLFDQILAGKYKPRFYEQLPLLPRLFGKLILHSVQPETQRKTPTVPVFEPSISEIPATILENFRLEQNRLQDYIGQLLDVPIHSIIITSPANQIVIYSLKYALDIITAHEQRHFLQAERILEQYQAFSQN
ncbi:MAG: DinB family protein [Bacteroidota bacterium]